MRQWVVDMSLAVATFFVAALLMFPLLYVAPFGALLVAALVYAALRRKRVYDALAVMSYMEQAMATGLPMREMLDAAARSEGGSCRRALHDVVYFWHDGRATLDVALRYSFGWLVGRSAAVLHAAEESGRIASALPRVVALERRRLKMKDANSTFVTAYVAVILLVMVMMLTFVLVFIVPQYEKIFEDFGESLPPITQFVMDISSWMTGRRGFPGAPLVFFAVLGGFCSWQSPWGRRMLAELLWFVPRLGETAASAPLADAAVIMDESIAAGLPLERSVEHAAGAARHSGVRRALNRWSRLLRSGVAAADAAERARMPAPFVAAVRSGEGGASIGKMIHVTALFYEGRWQRTQVTVDSVLRRGVIIVLGAIVGVIAGAMIMPLVALIQSAIDVAWSY